MLNNPLFLIVTPTYNRYKLLERSLNSVIRQNYQHWKLYVCDDCSSDSTQHLLANYKGESRITCLRMEENSGVNKVRNKILEAIYAGGHKGFVFLLDDDDYLAFDALERLSKLIKENPQERWFVTRCIDKYDKPITKIKTLGHQPCLFGSRRRNNVSGDASHCIDIDLIKDIRFTEKFRNGEEWYFFAYLAKKSFMFVSDAVTKVVEYQESGLTKSGYNLEKKVEVFELKVETLRGLVTEKQLASEQLSLARELIKSRGYEKARSILREIPLVKKFTLRFLRYQVRAMLEK